MATQRRTVAARRYAMRTLRLLLRPVGISAHQRRACAAGTFSGLSAATHRERVGAGGQILGGPAIPFGGRRTGGGHQDPYAGRIKALFLGDISEGAQNAHEIST